MLRLFFGWEMMLLLLELELELYKYIAMDLQLPHLAWRAVSLSLEQRMQDLKEARDWRLGGRH